MCAVYQRQFAQGALLLGQGSWRGTSQRGAGSGGARSPVAAGHSLTALYSTFPQRFCCFVGGRPRIAHILAQCAEAVREHFGRQNKAQASHYERPPLVGSKMTAAPAAGGAGAADAELLRKAVVSLERKLGEKAQALAAAEAEGVRLRSERERCQARLAEQQAAAAEAAALRRQLAGGNAELQRLREEGERLRAGCGAAEARAAEAAAAQERLAAQLAQWKADREAAEVGCIRARSEQQVQAALVVQLEAANEALRLNLWEQSARLQQAYERWAGGRG